MPTALIYSRVSTEEQANEGLSIQVQAEICRKWAQENKYQIVGTYIDRGKSATTLNGRKALHEAIIQCQEDKVNVLLVMDTDRLARNPADHFSIKSSLAKNNTKIVAVNQPMIDGSIEGALIETIMAGVNAFQSQITGRKVKKSLEKKVKDGWWPGWSPLGYLNINKGTQEKPEKIVKIDPVKGPLIKEVFRLYSTGSYSVDELVDLMFEKGLRSKNDKKVYRSVLYAILKNPFYIGLMKYKGKIYKGKHRPLTTPEIFETCQKVTNRHNHNACRRRKYKWLLSGFIYCNKCKSRLYASWNHKKKKAYYHGAVRNGCNQYIPLEEMENKVAKEFKKIQFSEEFTQKLTKKAKELVKTSRKNREKEIQSLQNAIKKLENKRNILEDNLLDQTIDKETFKRRHNKLVLEIQNLENQIATIENQRGFDIGVISEILALANNIYEIYTKANFEAKRHYLSIFFEKLEVKDKKIAKVIYTPLFQSLIKAKKVRVTTNWLPGWDDFRTANWYKIVKYPEIVMEETQKLIALTKSSTVYTAGGRSKHPSFKNY